MVIIPKIYTMPLLLVVVVTILFTWIWMRISSRVEKIFHTDKALIGLNLSLVILSIITIWYVTVGGRSTYQEGINLIPFSTLEMAKGQPEYYRTLFMNMLLFYPLGLFACRCFKNKKISFLCILLLSMIISCCVEVLQWKYSLGVFEIDDIIFNTIGGVLGNLVCTIMTLIVKGRN